MTKQKSAAENRKKRLAAALKANIAKMKAEGLVKAIGCGINFADACKLFLEFCDWDCFLLAKLVIITSFHKMYQDVCADDVRM